MSECAGENCDHSSHEKEKQMMTKLESIITPSDPTRWPLLEMPSQLCSLPLSPAEQDAIIQMDQILDALDDEAAGLAAVQIGVPRRIFLLRNAIDENGKTINTAYINPVIVAQSKETKKDNEACLSLPGMVARFPRPKCIMLEYYDIYGNIQTQKFSGFFARAVAHEINHLDGILITQHFSKEIAKQSRRTKYGMTLTEQKIKQINSRRTKNKLARKARKINR